MRDVFETPAQSQGTANHHERKQAEVALQSGATQETNFPFIHDNYFVCVYEGRDICQDNWRALSVQ
jgi:hypothetical protein